MSSPARPLSLTTESLGTIYEKNLNTGEVTTYYFAGSQAIAMRVQGDPVAANNGVFFLHSDHLGSASLTTDVNGAATARQLYDAWGNIRASASSGTMPTDIGYTGQRLDSYNNEKFLKHKVMSLTHPCMSSAIS